MMLPSHKTKIVCTIGPASESQGVLEEMLLAGMNVARINFSHGDFESHKKMIETVRAAARSTGRSVAVMADLPGPKIRIGPLESEPIELNQGDEFILTSEDVPGNAKRVSVPLATLPQAVRPGDPVFLNDGYIQLKVVTIEKNEIHCRVLVGGELRSRKGLNLPGIDLGVSAFTEHDRKCLEFALREGVDAVSQSFVQSAADIEAVRQSASGLGYDPFIIAKIERARALDNIDGILAAADGLMIARGDLGVETPIERIAPVQKELMKKANLIGKPVITATQMLESMTSNRRPTRAESTDVANAVLDGTDCVMLSAESAMGRYPVESVAMLGKIAAAAEPFMGDTPARQYIKTSVPRTPSRLSDLITFSVSAVVDRVCPAAVFVPTKSGATARSMTRFRLPVWIVAVSRHRNTCQRLHFSYGVHPVHELDHPDDWKSFARNWLNTNGLPGNLAVVTEGPSMKYPEGNHRMELVNLSD
ncbi:MAG TPA: pyruvate kinase [Desulfomonilaceae bacterium]|nr:pyruvate kinase [Desulfomonilaceae bacterium]